MNVFRVACIGSREISPEMEGFLFSIGAYIAAEGDYVSSGNANGSDEWYAKGVNSVDPTHLILYCVDKRHNPKLIVPGNRVTYDKPQLWSLEARKYHPAYSTLSPYVKGLMDRNMGIILRADCTLAVLNHSKKSLGGTGHGWRACVDKGIPALDVSQFYDEDKKIKPESLEKVKKWLQEQKSFKNQKKD